MTAVTRHVLRLLVFVLALTPLGNARAADAEDEDWPLSERLLERFAAGRYSEVAAIGLRLLEEEPDNEELRFAVADSLLWSGNAWPATAHYEALLASESPEIAGPVRLRLAHSQAWTGRMADAIPHYKTQLDGKLENESRLGLANALRWQGRQDLALPHYKKAILNQPNEEEALNGALYSERALRPRTQLGASLTKDNSPMQRQEMTLAHTWRNEAGSRIFTVESSTGREWDPELQLHQRETTFRVEDLGLQLAPRLDLTQQSTPKGQTFAHLRLRLNESPLYVNAGRVNWGKSVFNVHGLNDNLTANRFGLEGKQPTAAGELRGFINHFSIADSNRIDNGDLRLTPWWRPWGAEIRPYTGVTWRYSARHDERYWSPKTYAAGYFGLEGEWERRSWSFFAFGHVGFRLAGEAATYSAGGFTAKRWLDRDWSVALGAWAQSNAQGESYASHGLTLTLEKLW